jgi:predicted branched-subunit amino acid permease
MPASPSPHRAALRATLSLPGLVLLGSMIGFGGFAHGAGWSLLDTMLSTALIWALPGQVILVGSLAGGTGVVAALVAVSISSVRFVPMVCAILPVIRSPNKGPRLWVEIAAAHFCAQTVWILALLNAEKLPREMRTRFYFEMAVLTVSLSVVACGIGWLIAGRLPRPLDIALLMLTPVSFLLSTEKTAKGFDAKLAFALGLALLPPVHVLAPLACLGSWELLVTGLLAGSLAFAAGQMGGRA